MATIHYVVNTRVDGTQFDGTDFEDSITGDIKRVYIPQPGDVLVMTRRPLGGITFVTGNVDEAPDFPSDDYVGWSFVAIQGADVTVKQGGIWDATGNLTPGDRVTVTAPHAGDGATDYFQDVNGIIKHFRRFTGDQT